MANYTKKLTQTLLALLMCTAFTLNLNGQASGELPRSTPEAEGVSSEGIIDFLNAADTASRVELHSFIFIRHGKVIAEGWWDPYAPEYKHILYSASKTFTATAIGLAVSENRLKLTDKVYSFFPYSTPNNMDEFMEELTVQNLLMMSVGQDPEPSSMGNNGDWIHSFLNTPPKYKPGTVFKYNNMATFMLSAIVQQVTGQTVFDYLKPRLFDLLGIRGMDWDLNPQGINLGMIGLRLHTEDLAKFGQLLMQEGKWNNKQIIPKEWVKEATSFKIESNGGNYGIPQSENDWTQGYCYQMWRGRNNTVRLDGMGGQYVVLIPDKDAIVVLTANAKNTQDELNLIHNYLIPAIKSDKPLPANSSINTTLVERESGLAIKTNGNATKSSGFEAKVNGKEFILNENSYNIQSVYFNFVGDTCILALKRENKVSAIKAGNGKWIPNKMASASILSAVRSATSKSVDANYIVTPTAINGASNYSWKDDNTLELETRFVEESLDGQTISIKFSEINGVVGVTIEQKTNASMTRGTGATQQQAQLRGNLLEIK